MCDRVRPPAWMLNPASVTAKRVQYWSGGEMKTARMAQGEARKLVAWGSAFVLASDSIGHLDSDGYCDAGQIPLQLV